MVFHSNFQMSDIRFLSSDSLVCTCTCRLAVVSRLELLQLFHLLFERFVHGVWQRFSDIRVIWSGSFLCRLAIESLFIVYIFSLQSKRVQNEFDAELQEATKMASVSPCTLSRLIQKLSLFFKPHSDGPRLVSHLLSVSSIIFDFYI